MSGKSRRSLRLTVFLTVGTCLMTFLVVFFFIVRTTMSRMLLTSESSYLEGQCEIVEGIFQSTRANLRATTRDIANWQQTVDFAAGINPDYIKNNWPGMNILESYRYNFVVIQDRQGNDLYVEFYDQKHGRPLPVPEGFTRKLSDVAASVLEEQDAFGPGSPADGPAGRDGILFYRDIPYDVCILPAVVQGGSGEATGTVTFGNILDSGYFQTITHSDSISFAVNREPPGSEGFHYRDGNAHRSIPLHDIEGGSASLNMVVERTTYLQGRDTIQLATATLVITAVIFVAIIYFITVKLTLRPIEQLNEDIGKISVTGQIDPAGYTAGREFHSLCLSINAMMDRLDQSTVSTNVLTTILNGIDACIYVSHPDDDTILFINEKMKREFGLEGDLVGRICWQVLQSGMTERCEFCPNHRLREEPGAIVSWEEHSTVNGRYYHNTDRLIEWTDGNPVHLQHSTDITGERLAQEALGKRLRQQELMTAMSQSFISTEDTHILIEGALRMVGEFLRVGKIFLSERDDLEDTLTAVYSWHNKEQGIEPPRLISRPFVPGDVMYDAFVAGSKTHLACDDVEEHEAYAYFRRYGVKAFLAVPIYAAGVLWGVLMVDECLGPRHWDEGDIHLCRTVSSLISGVILRGRTEEDLHRMSSIVNSSPQYISFIDSNGNYKYLNQGVLNTTGYAEWELMENGIGILFDEESKKKAFDEIIPRIQQEGRYDFELPVLRKDGERRILSFSAFTTDVAADGMGTIASDITEKRRLEQDLIRAKEQAESSNRAKSDFLSRMSHEMRTPMNAIIGMTSIAQASDDSARKEDCMNKIYDASRHLLGVINDILDMSKIEADKFELSDDEFPFERMLQRVVDVINFRIDEKKQTFNVSVDRKIPPVLVSDEQRLAQVITNLLSNAVKFTPEEGAVSLSAKLLEEEDGGCVIRIEVADTGIGISEEQQTRLFRSFEQADGGISRRFGGTGLGLAISKRIVGMMGGEIGVISAPGKGSTFFFTFRARIGSNTGGHGLLAPETKWRDLVIMAVDDSADVLEYFHGIMESFGLSCALAESGEEALRLAGEAERAGKPFNMLFIDWRMPGMDGIELTRKIKDRFGKSTVVIMISATEWNEIERDARAAGVDRFLPKPLFSSRIADCINECLGAGMPEEESGGQDFTGRFEGKRVLLAEDIEINREIVIALLDGTGLEIECAENGRIAYEMVRDNPVRYDIVFMDIHMPEMDGYEAARKIRSLDIPEVRALPIVAMTANVFREDVERCLAAGMNDHVGKPIDMTDLYDKLKKHLK